MNKSIIKFFIHGIIGQWVGQKNQLFALAGALECRNSRIGRGCQMPTNIKKHVKIFYKKKFFFKSVYTYLCFHAEVQVTTELASWSTKTLTNQA